MNRTTGGFYRQTARPFNSASDQRSYAWKGANFAVRRPRSLATVRVESAPGDQRRLDSDAGRNNG